MKAKVIFKSSTFFSIFFFAAVACQEPQKNTEGEVETTEESSGSEPTNAAIPSPRKSAEGNIGVVKTIVDYGSPAVKGREVWGGLEAYGDVWRAGANETTSIEFASKVQIGDVKVEAGKYGFYLIPQENKPWIAIFNTDWNRDEHGAWGAYNYNRDNDVVRVEVIPEWSEDVQERLSYEVESDGIKLSWEKVRIKIPIDGVDQ